MLDFGFPQIPQTFLENQDLFYSQFNDIDFYVEDIDQENFYFRILKKLFPDLELKKIFPLGGKPPVTNAATEAIGDKKKVFIVDLDFDEILEKKKDLENLFYLDRYSIENYLIEEDSLINFIIEQKPKSKFADIKAQLSLTDFLNESRELFSKITKVFLVVQKYELGIRNVDYDSAYFCDFDVTPSVLREIVYTSYCSQVDNKLKELDNSYSVENRITEFDLIFADEDLAMSTIPGKYLLKFLKHKIEHLFSLVNVSLESFIYRLSGYCKLDSLFFIKTAISNYIA